MSQRQPQILRLVVSNQLEELPKPMALKFERVQLRRHAHPSRIALQAHRLQTLRPDVAALFEGLFDDLLAELVPPDHR